MVQKFIFLGLLLIFILNFGLKFLKKNGTASFVVIFICVNETYISIYVIKMISNNFFENKKMI